MIVLRCGKIINSNSQIKKINKKVKQNKKVKINSNINIKYYFLSNTEKNDKIKNYTIIKKLNKCI
jgi:hypothetical protein